MTLRRLITGTSVLVTVLAVGSSPVHAAPVDTARAILGAAEFPPGAVSYTAASETLTPRARAAGTTRCDIESFTAERSLSGALSTDASVRRGTADLRVGIISRPTVAALVRVERACASDPRFADRGRPVAAPADLAHYRSRITRMPGGGSYFAVVDLRGVSVQAGVAHASTPDDVEAFWRILRAQIAKVQRQP